MSDSHTHTPVPRSLPPRPDFDDALDLETLMPSIEAYGEYTETHEAGFEILLELTYDAEPLVSHIDQWADYRTCEEYSIVPPNVTSYYPESDRYTTHDEHGMVAPVDIPITSRQQSSMRSPRIQVGHQREILRGRLYRNIAEAVLGMLEKGYYDVPITDDVATEEGRTTVTVGHKRLHIEGIKVGADAYWRTERQAADAHYERDKRVQRGAMIAEDFAPYITDPPEHVRRYPEEEHIPTYGEPVNWDRMERELDIWSVRDVTDSEKEELLDAIHAVWPEEALT